MPSADQVPVNNPHSTMQWHLWVVLIAGSTGSALRAVRPPNLHITPGLARSRLRRERGWFLVVLALGHHRPGHPGELVGKRDRSDLGWPARQERREPGTVRGPVDLGITDDRQRPGGE